MLLIITLLSILVYYAKNYTVQRPSVHAGFRASPGFGQLITLICMHSIFKPAENQQSAFVKRNGYRK
jgi:hypothetical protein